MQRKVNLPQVICLRMGKTTEAKSHRVNLRSPLLRIHYYQNKQLQVKGIPIPNTNLQLNPYPNTQLDLFCSEKLFFSMHSSQYVTNQSMHGSQYVTYSPTWEGCWLQSSLVHQHDEDHEAPWLQNLMVYKHSSFLNRKRWTRAYVSGSQYACEKLLHWVASSVTALKTILIYV